jgi:hypothetical protein
VRLERHCIAYTFSGHGSSPLRYRGTHPYATPRKLKCYSPECVEVFYEVQLTREACSSSVPLRDNSAKPTSPHTMANTIASPPYEGVRDIA